MNQKGSVRKKQRWTVNSETGCWIWLLTKHPRTGRGMEKRNGKSGYAHRWAYQDAKGEIPTGRLVVPTCGNRLCVNPEHLVLEKEMVEPWMKSRTARTKLTDAVLAEIVRLRQMGKTMEEAGAAVGVSKTTARRWLSDVAAKSERSWILGAVLEVGLNSRRRKSQERIISQ